MDKTPPDDASPQSELRTIGRLLDDLPPVASTQGPRPWAPIAWGALGALLALIFSLCLTLGPPPSSLSKPKQSAVFSTPVRR